MEMKNLTNVVIAVAVIGVVLATAPFARWPEPEVEHVEPTPLLTADAFAAFMHRDEKFKDTMLGLAAKVDVLERYACKPLNRRALK